MVMLHLLKFIASETNRSIRTHSHAKITGQTSYFLFNKGMVELAMISSTYPVLATQFHLVLRCLALPSLSSCGNSSFQQQPRDPKQKTYRSSTGNRIFLATVAYLNNRMMLKNKNITPPMMPNPSCVSGDLHNPPWRYSEGTQSFHIG